MEHQQFFDRLSAEDVAIVQDIVRRRGSQTLICSKCGVNYRHLTKTKRLTATCMQGSCHPNFGKKRPEHGAVMAKLAKAGKLSGTFKKGYTNEFVNTVEWKRRVLDNKGISHTHLSDDELIEFYNEMKSQFSVTPTAKMNRARTLLSQYEAQYRDMFGDVPDLERCDAGDIDTYLRRLNQIKTNVCVDPNTSGAKRFRRSVIKDLRWNMSNKKQVTTKSSYETRYVLLFEDEGVSWEYEPFAIRDGENVYIPDFIFDYNGTKYMLEIKGYFKDDEQRETYFTTKLAIAVAWCEKNGYTLLFTFDGNPTTTTNIIKETVC